MTLAQSALDGYAYLDLEVDGNGQIFSYGLLSPRHELKVGSDQAEAIHAPLLDLTTATDLLCGHNIRRFDWLHLVKPWPDLECHPVSHALIDTLELSVLAFALAPSHKLGKHYKLSDYASNDPLEDARATRLLLEECLRPLDQHPVPLRQLYLWLITHGNTAADAAYCQLFSTLGWLPDLPPALADLPTEALAGTAWADLEDLPDLKNLDADFDSRLTLAALVVWNFERNCRHSKPGDPPLKYSVWLEHLPPFPTVRD